MPLGFSCNARFEQFDGSKKIKYFGAKSLIANNQDKYFKDHSIVVIIVVDEDCWIISDSDSEFC